MVKTNNVVSSEKTLNKVFGARMWQNLKNNVIKTNNVVFNKTLNGVFGATMWQTLKNNAIKPCNVVFSEETLIRVISTTTW